jgi:hypothetical protein
LFSPSSQGGTGRISLPWKKQALFLAECIPPLWNLLARQRLALGGCMYVLFSTESDLGLLGNLISRAGFAARLVAERSILIESMIIYELRVQ